MAWDIDHVIRLPGIELYISISNINQGSPTQVLLPITG